MGEENKKCAASNFTWSPVIWGGSRCLSPRQIDKFPLIVICVPLIVDDAAINDSVLWTF